MHCPFLDAKLLFLLCFFPFASSRVLSSFFGRNLAAVRHVYFGSTTQSLHGARFLPAYLVFFKSGHDKLANPKSFKDKVVGQEAMTCCNYSTAECS